MVDVAKKRQARLRRHRRVRQVVTGSSERPRVSVFRSLSHIYAQVVDDVAGRTLVCASTLDGQIRGSCAGLSKTEAARVVGRVLAERALASGVTKVVFDRGGYRFHGRVQALAEGAREGGLAF